MTPKEKAENLFQLFLPFVGSSPHIEDIKHMCKQCLYIVVNEIIPIVESYEDALSISQRSDELTYWNEVKQEIKKV